jgi:hypothetical protein
VDSWEILGRRTWTAGGVQLFFDAVAVQAGEHHQLERDRGRRETARLEIAGIQLHVGATDFSQGFEVVLVAPVEPQT